MKIRFKVKCDHSQMFDSLENNMRDIQDLNEVDLIRHFWWNDFVDAYSQKFIEIELDSETQNAVLVKQ